MSLNLISYAGGVSLEKSVFGLVINNLLKIILYFTVQSVRIHTYMAVTSRGGGGRGQAPPRGTLALPRPSKFAKVIALQYRESR